AGGALPRGELRARQPVDELRPAGLPRAARDLDGGVSRRGRRPRGGARRAAAPAGRAGGDPMAAAPRVSGSRVGRRAFLGGLAAAGCAALTPRAARAEDGYTVGVVPPPDADKATELGRGAALGLDDANALATLFGKRLRLETEVDRGDGQAGRTLARAGALAIVGGAVPGGGEALLQAAGGGAPVLNVSAPDDRLRNEGCDRRAFHLTPSVSMYVDALAQVLIEQRKLARWALVGDGSPRGGEIEAAARRSVAARGGTVIAEAAA